MYTVLSRGGVVVYIILVYRTSRKFAHVRPASNLKSCVHGFGRFRISGSRRVGL